MTILTIRTIGDPVLRTTCEPVTTFDDHLKKLIEDMFETMYQVQGVGLAGPQVGVNKRIFTFGNIDNRQGYIINPVLETGNENQEGGEGCLSVPGLSSETPRKQWARVRGVDSNNQPLEWEGQVLFARMLQHESDHLNGKLFIDRVQGEDRKRIMQTIRQSNYNQVSAAVRSQRSESVSSGFVPPAFRGK